MNAVTATPSVPTAALLPGRLRIVARTLAIDCWCPHCRRLHRHGWPHADARLNAVSHRVAHCGPARLKEHRTILAEFARLTSEVRRLHPPLSCSAVGSDQEKSIPWPRLADGPTYDRGWELLLTGTAIAHGGELLVARNGVDPNTGYCGLLRGDDAGHGCGTPTIS